MSLNRNYLLLALVVFLSSPQTCQAVHIKKWDTYDIHGATMTLFWALIPFIGQISTLYLNHKRYSGIVHSLAGIFACTATIVTVCIFWNEGELKDRQGDLQNQHAYGGFIVLGISILQVLVGLTVKGAMVFYKGGSENEAKTSVWTYWARRFHVTSGYLVILLSVFLVWSGTHMHWPDNESYIIVWYGLVFLLEALLWIQKYNYQKKGYEPVKLTEDLDHGAVSVFRSEEEFRKKWEQTKPLWVVYEGSVYDVGDYAIHHPGGRFIFGSMTYHDDVGRYLDGGYGLSAKMPANFHGKATLEDLLPRMRVADLEIDQGLVRKINGSLDSLSSPNWQGCSITSKRYLTADIAVFVFSSPDMTCSPEALTWTDLGRHFRLSARIDGDEVTRYYSSVFAFSAARTRKRLEYFQKLQIVSQFDLGENVDPTIESGLPLCIKRYSSNAALSPFLHRYTPVGGHVPEFTNNFTIRGPSGIGLGLTPESKGVYIALIGGTGVLPLLDLYDMILEKAMTEDAEEGSDPLEGFKIISYVTFESRKEAIGLDIMQACQKACQQGRVKAAEKFEFFFSREDGKPMRAEMVAQNPAEFKNAEKIFVCGPASFNDDFKASLKEIGVPREKISFI